MLIFVTVSLTMIKQRSLNLKFSWIFSSTDSKTGIWRNSRQYLFYRRFQIQWSPNWNLLMYVTEDTKKYPYFCFSWKKDLESFRTPFTIEFSLNYTKIHDTNKALECWSRCPGFYPLWKQFLLLILFALPSCKFLLATLQTLYNLRNTRIFQHEL